MVGQYPHRAQIARVARLRARGCAVPQPDIRRPVTYLIRAWVAGTGPSGVQGLRYLIERVGDDPRRRGFDSFEAMVGYLRAELLGKGEAADGAADDEAS